MGIKYKVNENFFDEWTHQMAYVLGFWFADGSIEYAPAMRGRYIRVCSTDREVIVAIKEMMKSGHTIVETKRPQYKTYYLLRIGNQKLFESIQNRGITERKSLTTMLPDIPKDFLVDFIRGYFDGDGCVYLDKRGKTNYRRLSTIFTSGSKQYLEQLREVLHLQAGMSDHLKITVTKGGFSEAFQLRYSTGDSTKLYKLMYSPTCSSFYLKRKRNKFEEYFKSKGQVVKW